MLVALISLVILVSAGSADEPLQAPVAQYDLQPSGPRLELQPAQPAQPEETQFWMVNSYFAPQHVREQGRGPLLYQRRTSGGWRTATQAEFQTHFVPGVPVVIVIHGSFVDSRTQYSYADATYRWLRAAASGRPLHMIYYSWPSGPPYTTVIPVDIAVRGCRAEFNAFHVAHVVTMIPPESPVCLIGHSHGARMALATLHLSSGGAIHDHVFADANRCPHRLRAILAAAAVDHNWLDPGERYDRALLAADVVNFKNRNDLPLNLYPLIRPFARPTLATVGFTGGDRQELGPLGWRAVDVDVSQLVQEGHTWPNYLRSQAIADAMVRYIYFDDEITINGERAAALELPSVQIEHWQEIDD